MDFRSLTGQETVVDILRRTADRDQLPNSYLFAGAEGVGKWAAALALTAYLNCRNQSNGDSCGQCPPCRQIEKLQFPNLHIAVPTPPSKSEKEEHENYWGILNGKIEEPFSLITGKKMMSIPVAAVRAMRQSLAQKPPVGGKRVVIIEQMDRMLTASADSLLKLVEEPPSQTVIIITSSRPEKLLETIISRCRRIRFPQLPESTVEKYMTKRTRLGAETSALLARLSGGSIGRALYLSDDDNRQDREIGKVLFKGIFLADLAQVVAEAVELLPLRDRFRVNRILGVWQSLFRDLMLLQSGADTAAIINIDFAAELEKLAGQAMNRKALLKIPAGLGEVITDIDLNVETKSAVGAAIINIHSQLQLT
ncbi:MAG: AAA family ATPase [FCB group bacterium]|nr:AAA family ATPase [FCB group bacterium]